MSAAELDQIADAFPLTPLQSGMLFHVLAHPVAGQYVGTLTALINGPLQRDAAQRAWQELLARHEALRTSFLWEGLDEPMQVVHNHVPLDFQWHEDGNWKTHADEVRTLSFDVSSPALMHLRIVAQGADQFRLIWAVHHLIADGWSANLLLSEFLALLNDQALPAAPAFVTHAEWLDGLNHEEDADFWHGYLAGYVPEPLTPKGDGTGFGKITHQLTPDLIANLKAQAGANNVTLSTHLQAGFAHAVGHLGGSRDVMFGLATSGRSSPIENAGNCVGLFVNTLPVRVELDAPDLLLDLEDTSLSLRSREHVPQSLLMKWTNTPPGQSLTQVVLSLRSLPNITRAGAYSITDLDVQTPSNFPLVVEMDPETGAISALFNRTILNTPQVTAFLTSFELALRSANEPAQRIAAIAGPELEQPSVDVVTRILAHVETTPDAVALSDPNGALTYAQMHQSACAVAAYLSSKNVGQGDRVALVFARSSDMVCALLGALMCGAAYVPIDADYPQARIDAILGDCTPKLVLGQGGVALSEMPKVTSFDPAGTPQSATAYVIYTSGSTGTPKGVEISRGGLAASQTARDQFYPTVPSAFLLMSPFAFDSSVVGIFWALCSGANLVITGPRAEQDIAALSALIAQHEITHTLMLPTLYQAVISDANPATLSTLRQVVVAGETCPRSLPQLHAAKLPECWLANEYGPTEATVWATAELNGPREAAPMSIGKPIAGMQIYLLGPSGKAVSAGEIGEIALAGPGLATGYLNRDAQTAQAFPELALGGGDHVRIYRTGDRGRLTPDGRIAYLGRGDAQVKIRGHRIELQEVEAALTSLEGVTDAAVVPIPARPADRNVLQAALDALDPNVAATLIGKAKTGGKA